LFSEFAVNTYFVTDIVFPLKTHYFDIQSINFLLYIRAEDTGS
jgi:hypothetical protein